MFQKDERNVLGWGCTRKSLARRREEELEGQWNFVVFSALAPLLLRVQSFLYKGVRKAPAPGGRNADKTSFSVYA